MFDLKRPCADCPFRSDKPFYLGEARRREIMGSLLAGLTFQCHKTVDYSRFVDGEPEQYLPSGEEQHCAGAMILLSKIGEPNQAMQVGERLGYFDPGGLELSSPVFEDERAFVEEGA